MEEATILDETSYQRALSSGTKQFFFDIQSNELEQALLNNQNLDELLAFDFAHTPLEPDLSFADFTLLESLFPSEEMNLDTYFQIGSEGTHSDCSEMTVTEDQSTMSSFSADFNCKETKTISIKVSEVKSNKSYGRVTKNSGESTNKLAAQKYRSKKIQLRDQLFADCEHYEKLNKELRTKIEDVQSEVNLIKTLLVQVYLAKK